MLPFIFTDIQSVVDLATQAAVTQGDVSPHEIIMGIKIQQGNELFQWVRLNDKFSVDPQPFMREVHLEWLGRNITLRVIPRHLLLKA